MIGDLCPGRTEMHLGTTHAKATHIDAIETEKRQRARIAARWTPNTATKGFDQAEPIGKQPIGSITPVVEIAGDDQRSPIRCKIFHTLGERLHLPLTPASGQTQVDADAMHRDVDPGQLNLAMQQPAALEAVRRDVLIGLAEDGMAAEDGIAMVTVVVDRIAAIGGLLPALLSQELMLRLRWPARMTPWMSEVQALHPTSTRAQFSAHVLGFPVSQIVHEGNGLIFEPVTVTLSASAMAEIR